VIFGRNVFLTWPKEMFFDFFGNLLKKEPVYDTIFKGAAERVDVTRR